MRAEELVQLIAAAAPSDEDMRAHGLDDDDVRDLRSMYLCSPRRSSDQPADELQRLLMEFDCSRLEISSLCFKSPPVRRPEGLLVGKLEADPVIQLSDGTVVVYDHGIKHAKPVLCAVSGVAFVDAIAVRLRGGAGRSGTGPAIVEECERTAGVESRNPFWIAVAG